MRKLFAWDFHGTLEEGVEVGFWQILKQLRKKYKTSVKITLPAVRKKYGVSVANYLRYFFPECNTSQIKAMMKKVAEIQNQKHLKKYVKPAPNAIKVLSKIKAAGGENIVVSNSHPNHINPLIDIVGMRPLIGEVYAVDRHYSVKKQDPTREKAKILKKIIQRGKVKRGQLIIIGDKANDINAGLAVNAVTYQYLRKGFPYDKTRADYKISDLRQILKEI